MVIFISITLQSSSVELFIKEIIIRVKNQRGLIQIKTGKVSLLFPDTSV